MGYPPEPALPHGTPQRTALLLVNLGTPDAPTAPALRRYLREFLSDPRVVEIPQLVWQPILRGIILNTRPKKSAHAYAQVLVGLSGRLELELDGRGTWVDGACDLRTAKVSKPPSAMMPSSTSTAGWKACSNGAFENVISQ